jgi:nicotinamide-nucleotide adenylyltransferase
MNDGSVMLGVRKIAPRLLQRLLDSSSYPPVELVYASHPDWPLGFSKTRTPRTSCRISVLDSSFNPPTLAHLALANSHLPLEWTEGANAGSQESIDYDAKLLLLSVKNADKVLKPGDASYLQRLEMMSLLAQRITTTNVAIAITNEPTFVQKSEALLAFLKQKIVSPPTQTQPTIELTFIVGSDTLDRLFSPRYYPSETNMRASLQKFLSSTPDGDNSRIVSASRNFMPITSQSTMETQKASALAKHYLDLGRIAIVGIGEELSTYSSSAVRSTIARDGLTPGDETRPLWHKFVTTEIAKYIVEEQLYAIH